MNINTVDLNLFLVFHAIYRNRSVTLAGERIGMTQSAVSNALKRLRERFDDMLFVRAPDGMLPTPLAERMIGPVEAALAHLSNAIDHGRHFDPATSNRAFRIAINEVGHLVLIPRLLRTVRERAPNVRFETVDATPLETRQCMLQGQIDLAIGSWDAMGPAFHQQRLFDESFVVVMSRDHPLSDGSLGMENYVGADHLAFRPHGSTDNELQHALQGAGVPVHRRVVLAAAHSQGLAQMVRSTGLLLTAPSRLAHVMASECPELRIVPAPFAMRPFQIRQQWHERVHQDSAHRWLRELIFALFHESSAWRHPRSACAGRLAATTIPEF